MFNKALKDHIAILQVRNDRLEAQLAIYKCADGKHEWVEKQHGFFTLERCRYCDVVKEPFMEM